MLATVQFPKGRMSALQILPSQMTLTAPFLAASAEWTGMGETLKVKVEVCWQDGVAEVRVASLVVVISVERGVQAPVLLLWEYHICWIMRCRQVPWLIVLWLGLLYLEQSV